MITGTVQKMAEITDPDELVEFLAESVTSYKKAAKPKTRLEYALLILMWALTFYLTSAGATYLWNLFVATGLGA